MILYLRSGIILLIALNNGGSLIGCQNPSLARTHVLPQRIPVSSNYYDHERAQLQTLHQVLTQIDSSLGLSCFFSQRGSKGRTKSQVYWYSDQRVISSRTVSSG